MLVMAIITGSVAFAAESTDEAKIPALTSQAVFLTKEAISNGEKQKILNALQNLESKSKVAMTVLVVDSVAPSSIEEYGIKVADKWKIGKSKDDNGLILIVATQDRKARIEVGYGMEGQITDAISSRIINDYMIPEFKQKNWYGGIMQAIGRVENIAQNKPLDAPINPDLASASKVHKSSSNAVLKGLDHVDGDLAIVVIVIFAVVALFTTSIGKAILAGIVIGAIIHHLGKSFGSIVTAIGGGVGAGVASYLFLDGAWYVGIISGAIFGCFGLLWLLDLLQVLASIRGGSGSSSSSSSSSSSRSSSGYSGGGGRFGGGGSSGSW